MFLNDILSKKLKENDQRNFNAKLDQLKDHIESVSQQNVSENMANFFANKAKELYPNATVRKDGETLQEPPKREVPKVEPAPVDIEKLKTVLVNLEKKYKELGGDSWQYADRMMPRDYEAQAISKEINRLKSVIARNSDVSEGSLNEFAPTFGGDDDENIVDLLMSYMEQNYPKAVNRYGVMTVYEVINDRASMGYYRSEEMKDKDLDDLATDVLIALEDEYDDEGLDEGAEAGAYYYEELAQKVFGENPELNSSGSASEVLDAAYTIARNDLGDRRARALFTYDEDFPGDLVTAYAHLQKQGVAEGLPKSQDPQYNPDGSKKPHWHELPFWQQFAKDQEKERQERMRSVGKKKGKEKDVAEAAKGILHRVRYQCDDPSGSGIASGHYTVNAPDKTAAARYAVSDLTKKGKKNVQIKSVTPQTQGVAEGTVKRTATGLTHTRDYPSLPGSEFQSDPERLNKTLTGKLDKAFDVKWDPINKRKEISADPTGVAEGEEQDDPYKGTTPVNGKVAARNGHRLSKTYKNPHSPKYHKDAHARWDREYNHELSRLKSKGVAEGRPSNYKPPKEADYGDDYQDMVKRVANQEKAKQAKKQEKKTTNEDISDIIESRLMRMRRAGYDL